MKFFPITIVDNFFDNPDEVLDMAMNVEYNEPQRTNYPGVTSRKMSELNPSLFNWTMEKVISIYFGQFWQVGWNCDMEFQKITPCHDKDNILNKGAIHFDPADCQLAGLIYLNKNPSKDAGTSFYKKKDQFYTVKDDYLKPLRDYHSGKDVSNIEEVCTNHFNQYQETARVQAEYNRFCFYSPDIPHAPTTYGDQVRYTMRMFVTSFDANRETFPLTRRI
tara:strand:+ start:336 stop:995 length:660 start_codon:yes stop_codon:yes gene_type:complete